MAERCAGTYGIDLLPCNEQAGHGGPHEFVWWDSDAGAIPAPAIDSARLCPRCGDARHDGWGCVFCGDSGPCALSDHASRRATAKTD